jgi:hypothetical protein
MFSRVDGHVADPHRSATGAALPLGAALTGALWFTHITHLFQRVWASTVVVTRLGCARSAPPVLACRASRHDRSLTGPGADAVAYPVGLGHQVTGNQLDAVFAGPNGAVNIMWVVGTGNWQGPDPLTGPGAIIP